MKFFTEPIIAVEPRWQKRYRIFRGVLYGFVILIAVLFISRTLFPTLIFSFNFKTPSSSKNNILAPRSETGVIRTNGKVEAGGVFIANTAAVGSFSGVHIRATLENKSALPETLDFSLRRSYQSFFLPTGPAIGNFVRETLYHIDTIYYVLRDNILYPFVSEQAYLSAYPESFALPATEDLLKQYPVSEQWVGFRVGSLVSFADGIYIIVSDTEMRPIGSADIFVALGYHFEDVIAGNEEEIGIYKRGRIFLLGAVHPDGTLLLDQDTRTYYLVDQGFKRPIESPTYRDFLLSKQTPITVSSLQSEIQAKCDLTPSFSGRTFSCSAPIDMLAPGFGNDFEIHLAGNDTDIDINTLTVSLDTLRNDQNMFTLLAQIKQRLFSRFGISS